MFLKSIEIQGFKSFAHKTVLSFNEGMTAVVGPNGSGKSNIADAVRWVLGEQKVKQLRGQSMQDVIFAGTELRKPLGFAFVAMTFDNSDHALALDYQEVTVSRRLYRSGESEYMLNGQNVRLKDVQELFFDTGIGKEGYSIIGQGQIEAIVSGRPEDRRGLFDEACGIVKFKKRKAASVKKLEDEELALARVTDILSELEKRVGPLEKQSKGAREYLRLHDSLRHYDLLLFAREGESILREISESEKNQTIAENALSEAKEEGEELRKRNEELSENLRIAEERGELLQEEIRKGELLIQNLENQITVSETEIGADENAITNSEELIERLLRSRSDRLETVRGYLSSSGQLVKDLAVLKETGESEDVSSLFEEVTACQERLRALLPEETDPETEEESPEAPGEEEAEEEDFEFEMPDWMQEIRSKRDDLSEIREKEEKVNAWIRSASDEYNRLTALRKTLGAKLSEAEAAYNRAFSRYETLKNISERYEGYGQSVQNVMSRKQSYRGIIGVAADIIHTRKEYETAVETALGQRLQNIVTDTEQTARQVIDYLKRNRLGRATFLPLDAVRARVSEEYRKACTETGCLGLASDLVDTEPEYEDLVISLLGNTLVFENVDQAIRCARKYRHNLRIVTLEGELLSPGGAISGGTFKNSSNLMGRSREISELREQCAGLKDKLGKIGESIRETEGKIAGKDQELESLGDQLRSINNEKNELSFGIMSDIKVKISNLRQSSDFIKENLLRIEAEVSSQDQEIETIREKISENTESIREKRAGIEERKADILHVKNALSEKREEKNAAEAERDRLKAGQTEYFSRKDEITDRILSLEKDVIRIENAGEKAREKLDQKSDYIWTEYEKTLSEAKKEEDSEALSLTSLRENIQDLKSSIKKLGPVNVQAIEEYKEVSERYGLMKAQHEDICASRNEITSIITELDEGMKEQFRREFERIDSEFQKVFRELFGGGEASLELILNEEDGACDELTAGIGINAQPPGKKLQNMMQLSGGEKALTAIALLFAIQNLKPSPFCLLDEIEAALDDSNVLRFAQYIRRISQRIQFILITHRRGTMEAADRLYGITMQEKGVTALVSVDLVSDSLN